MKLHLLPTAAVLLVACNQPATNKDAPAHTAKDAPAHTAKDAPAKDAPAKDAPAKDAPAKPADAAAASAADPAAPSNDVDGFKPNPKYDEYFKPAPLTDEEKKLLERDPKTLTPEEYKAWGYAYRKKSLANPDSPGARAIRQAGENVLSGNTKPNLEYKSNDPQSSPPAQATE